MITDEQVNVACNRINERHSYTVASKKAMREVLETFEQSKWVKFDIGDVSTWPPMTKQPYASIQVMVYCTDNKETFYGSQFVTNLHRLLPTNKGYSYWIHPFDRDKRLNVTHWQPLPEFKE